MALNFLFILFRSLSLSTYQQISLFARSINFPHCTIMNAIFSKNINYSICYSTAIIYSMCLRLNATIFLLACLLADSIDVQFFIILFLKRLTLNFKKKLRCSLKISSCFLFYLLVHLISRISCKRVK